MAPQNERLSDGKRFLTHPPQRAYSSDIGPEWEMDPTEIDWRKSFLIGKVSAAPSPRPRIMQASLGLGWAESTSQRGRDL